MEAIPLPKKVAAETTGDNRATIVIEPCYPGYGTTLGNAVRRVLLSSLGGAAVTHIRIKGVQHEFSTLPFLKEDIVDFLLNIKQLRVKIHEGEEATLTLNAKGEKAVTAGELTGPSNVEVMNKDLVLATLTDKSAEFELEVFVKKGRGYVPVEAREEEKTDIGLIAVDAIYTPVKVVNFDTEHVRVGKMTNYDKLTLDIATDGSISPTQAFNEAVTILVEQFQTLASALEVAPTKAKRKSKAKADKEATEEAATDADEAPKEETAVEEQKDETEPKE